VRDVSADQTNPLDDIRLLDRKTVADALGVAADTLDDWCRRGLFPRAIQARAGGPKRWPLKTVKDWIERRKRARYSPPSARGSLRRGNQLKRRA
jgi:predicted DNA-binding transcriptional regulator AlpA